MLAWQPRRDRRARPRTRAPFRARAVSGVSRSMSAPLSWRFAAAGCSATPPRRGRDGGGVPPRRRWSALALSARRSSGAEGFDRDAPIAGIRANVRSALDLFRNTVEAGGAARVSFDRTVKDTPGYAARGLVLDALEKITGLPVAIEGTLRLYPDGIVINRLTVGEDMTVDKLLVRAELQPLLAVLDAWKTDPAAAAELRVDAIRGARRVNLNRAQPTACAAPSTSTAPRRAPSSSPNSNSTTSASTSPRTTPTKVATRLPRDVSFASPRSSSRGWTRAPPSPTSPPSSSRWTNSDKTPSREKRRGCTKTYEASSSARQPRDPPPRDGPRQGPDRVPGRSPTLDPGGPRRRRRRRLPSSSSSSSDPRGSSLDPFASFRAFVPAALMSQVDRAVSPEVIALANASRAVMETAAPAAAAQLAAVLADGGASASELARAGGTGEVMLDVGLVTALLTAGLPRRFLANGGALMVKLVESGVGAELLRRGDVLRALVERRMIDRLLDLDLMEALLDRPELTKAMFRSGVVRGVLSNGVLEALLAAGKEEVCVSILRGPMIEILMDTGMLPR